MVHHVLVDDFDDESLSSELSTFFRGPDLLSEEGLHEIFRRYGLRPNDHNNITPSSYVFFHWACMNERITEEIIEYILRYFPGAIGATGEDGSSPLHWACYNPSVTLNIIHLLVDKAPDSVRNVDNGGTMPLHWLCVNKKLDEAAALEILNLLIRKHPAAVTHADDGGRLPIHLACLSRSGEFCQKLINEAPNSVTRVDKSGCTPLHHFCNRKRRDEDEAAAMQVLNLLIYVYPEAVRRADICGCLPIHYACTCRSPEFCQALIDAAPESLRNVTNGGWMPLHMLCASSGHDDEGTAKEILELFIERYSEAALHANNDGQLPIHIASKSRSPEFCQALLNAAPNSVSSIDISGCTPLHYFCNHRRRDEDEAVAIQVLNLLMEGYSGAIRRADNCGGLPIHYACTCRSPELCRALIDAAPESLRNVTNGGWMPLHMLCASSGHDDEGTVEQILELFIERYPEAVLHANNEGSLPIHLACQWRSPEFCQALLVAAPDSIRSKDKYGWSPLHHLCGVRVRVGVNTIQTLKLLIEYDPEAVRQVCTNSGRLPIHDASLLRSPEFCRLLIEAYPGSEQKAATDGALPLHWACAGNTLPTVEYMYGLFPDAINRPMQDGLYPIHGSIINVSRRDDPRAAVEIVQFLLDSDPNVKLQRFEGKSLLQYACEHNFGNTEAGIEIINVIVDAFPASVRSVNNEGRMPLHSLCINSKLDEAAAMQILKFLLKKYSAAVRHADNDGYLPIHLAIRLRSPEFCRLLIEAHPGSERRTTTNGELPLHLACAGNTLPTVEYMYGLFPDAIDHAANNGMYPIVASISNISRRDDPRAAVEIVQFLLDSDLNVNLQRFEGKSLLQYACEHNDLFRHSNIHLEAGIEMIKILFDSHPEAIEEDRIVSNVHRYHQQVQLFMKGELVYARQAKDHRQMTSSDENGQLPLHRALQNNVRLGSIKLLVNGNSSAIRNSDKNGVIPLHVACQYHDSACVVGYIASLADETIDTIDRQGNTALHYACLGAKYETIALLLDKYDAVSVSRRNAHKKLPIELLWESNAVEDRGSVEYTDSVFRLLKAFPDTLTSTDVTQSFARLRI